MYFVEFFALHIDDRAVYIVMEYMPLGDLGKYIDFLWDEADAKIVAHQLLLGLKFMHAQNITHRDLKPAVST